LGGHSTATARATTAGATAARGCTSPTTRRASGSTAAHATTTPAAQESVVGGAGGRYRARQSVLMVTSRPRRSRCIPLLLLASSAQATLLSVPARAFAQANDPTLQAAHDRFAEGVAFFDKGEFERARASFLQAYALHKHPAVLMNLAQSSLRSGHTLDADHYFLRYLHESTSLTPEKRAEAEKGLAEARLKLGRLDITAPAGAAVTVDGETMPADGPSTIDVEPGSHTVKAADESATVSVSAGQTVPVKLVKSKPPPVVAPVEPIAPPAEPPPPSGPPPPPPAEPAKPHGLGLFSPPESTAPVYVGGAVGLVGFAGAIIFAVFEGSAQSSYNNEASAVMGATKGQSVPCQNPKAGSQLASACSQLNSDASDGNTDATIANVGVGVGIAGLAFAAGWYLFAHKAQPKEPSASWVTHISPTVGRESGGLKVSF
jgi:hypothetical protein